LLSQLPLAALQGQQQQGFDLMREESLFFRGLLLFFDVERWFVDVN
jgi:hypothetical protein